MDLFVEDGEAVQAALLDVGFVEVGEPEDYDDSHHLRPVAHPTLPFAVEVHRRPKWPNQRPPTFDEVLDAASPAAFAVSRRLRALAGPPCRPAGRPRMGARPAQRVGPLADIAALTLAAGHETVAASHAPGAWAAYGRRRRERSTSCCSRTSRRRVGRSGTGICMRLVSARCSKGTSSGWSVPWPPLVKRLPHLSRRREPSPRRSGLGLASGGARSSRARANPCVMPR